MQSRRSSMANTDNAGILAELAIGIQSGRSEAVEEMYSRVMPGLKAFLSMRVQRDCVDDCSHEIFLALIRFIESGTVRDFRCLPGIMRTIAIRIIAEHKKSRYSSALSIDAVTLARCVPDLRSNPEAEFEQKARMTLALQTLAALKARDRELLRRFYLEEQSQEQICLEMGLTETQFRLLKSRAKARFGELGRKRMRRPMSRVA